MQKATVTIFNSTGIHMRVASFVVQKANQFRSEIYLEKGTTRANCKSILGVVSLALRKGEKVNILIEGPDEEKAIAMMKDALAQEYRVTPETI